MVFFFIGVKIQVKRMLVWKLCCNFQKTKSASGHALNLKFIHAFVVVITLIELGTSHRIECTFLFDNDQFTNCFSPLVIIIHLFTRINSSKIITNRRRNEKRKKKSHSTFPNSTTTKIDYIKKNIRTQQRKPKEKNIFLYKTHNDRNTFRLEITVVFVVGANCCSSKNRKELRNSFLSEK